MENNTTKCPICGYEFIWNGDEEKCPQCGTEIIHVKFSILAIPGVGA